MAFLYIFPLKNFHIISHNCNQKGHKNVLFQMSKYEIFQIKKFLRFKYFFLSKTILLLFAIFLKKLSLTIEIALTLIVYSVL